MRSIKGNKTQFTEQDVEFIQKNFYTMTNSQLAKALNMTLTVVRKKCYELGLKRMELEYWTVEQMDYLKANYKTIGDVELADYFNATWPKNKGWNKKHIEKKRRYLKFKRTPEEIKAIHKRNVKLGKFAMCAHHMWKSRGVYPVGTIRIWKTVDELLFKVIKTESGFVHYAPWLWEKHYGPIPKGMCIRTKDDSLNITIDNLEMITRSQHAKRNSNKRICLPPELRKTISLINKLNKKIQKHEK